MLIDQFTRSRDGDRFFYTRDPFLQQPGVRALLDPENLTLANIIRRNTGVAAIQDHVFFDPSILIVEAPAGGADLTVAAAGGVLTVVLIFFSVKGPGDYLMVPLIFSSVSLITGLLGQYIAFKRLGVSFRFPGYTSLRKQIAAGWDIFISNVAINAYTTTRIFAIGLLTNNTITGYYAIAEKLAGLCQTFPLASFSQALFPRLSKIFQKNKTRAYELMQRIQLITINISLICLPLIFVFAHPIIKTIFGGDYPETVLSFRLLLVSVLFISSNAFRVQFLLIAGKTHLYSRIHVMMAMIGLPVIFMLIISFSYVGAAIATILIEAGIFAVTYVTVRRLKFS
jgi:PST family polysaccharide transporter